MKYSVLPLAAFVAMVLADSNPAINTPVSVTECETTSLTFSGTSPPFVISAIPGGQAGATPYETIVTTSVSPYPWLVNLAQGTYFSLQIRDSVGNLQYSSPITVLGGTDTSCVGTNSTGVTVSTSAVSTSAGGSTTSTIAASLTTTATGGGSTTVGTSSTITTKAGSSTSSTGTSTSSTTTSTKGAASHIEAKLGLAGVLGFIGAALMI